MPPATSLSVTFVMPNFNHAQFLRSSVAALLAQTCPADKILLIDDASTDNSLEILREFAAAHPCIELIERKENIGVVSNLNDGLLRCETDLVVFPAADDLVFPDFLERCVPMLEQHPQTPFAAACAQLRDDDDNITGARPLIYPLLKQDYASAETYRHILRRSDNHFLAAVTVYRTSALRELGGFDEMLGSASDGVLTRRLAARHGFCFIPRQLGVWRNYGTNYSSTLSMDPDKLEHMIEKMQSVIAAEPQGLFDKDYAAQLAQRMRFNGARLLIAQDELKNTATQQKLEQWGLPSTLIRLAASTGKLGR